MPSESTHAKERRARHQRLRLERAFFLSSQGDLAAVRLLVPGRGSENPTPALKLSSMRRGAQDVPFYIDFLRAGMVPPLSKFCLAVLSSFGLLLAQLHPQAVLLMSIFAHLCENFLGIEPSVALFCHYYKIRIGADPPMGGGATFALRSTDLFLPGKFKSAGKNGTTSGAGFL